MKMLKIFILLSILNLLTSYSNEGYQITDLYNNTFFNDSLAWNSSANGSFYLNCLNQMLYGYNLPFSGKISRTYTNLDPHKSIFIVFSFWRIDSWDPNDYVTLEADYYSFQFTNLVSYNTELMAHQCANLIWKEFGESRVVLWLSHTNPTLTLKLMNNLIEGNNASFGINKVTITLLNVSTPSLSLATTGSVSLGWPLMSDYPGFSNNSSYCSPGCRECKDSTPNGCLNCVEGREFYFNGTSCLPCPKTCKLCTSEHLCAVNSCLNNEFFFSNDTCIASCEFPLVVNTSKIGSYECVFPCDVMKYLWFNQSCSDTCPYPYISRYEGGLKYCDDNPCIHNASLSKTYFDDGSCLDCPFYCTTCASATNCLSCSFPTYLANNSCICMAGTSLNSSSICESNSFIKLTSHNDIDPEVLILKANVSYAEVQAYPDRIYHWNVQANSSESSISKISLLLANQTGLNVSIPYGYFRPQLNYNFTCSFVNILNFTISSSTLIDLAFLIPEVEAPLTTPTIKRYEENFIRIFLIPKILILASSHYKVLWEVSNESISNYQVNQTHFIMPKCSLRKNKAVSIKVLVEFIPNSVFNTTKEFLISPEPDYYNVTLNSEEYNPIYSRSINISSKIEFLGNCSNTNSNETLYNWSCLVKLSNTTYYRPCSDPLKLFNNFTSNSTMTIPSSYNIKSSSVIISLTTKRDSNLMSSANKTFYIHDTNISLVEITCISGPCVKYNPSGELLLKVWTDREESAPLYNWSLNLPITSIPYGKTLYIKGNSELYNQEFLTIKCNLIDPVYYGEGILLIPINKPPENGILVSKPSSGSYLNTQFNISASNWLDSDLPISYEFYFKLGEDLISLARKQSSESVQTILPGSSDHVLPVYCYIYDSLGAYAIANTSIIVSDGRALAFEGVVTILKQRLSNLSLDSYQAIILTSLLTSQLFGTENSWLDLRENLSYCEGCNSSSSSCLLYVCYCRNQSDSLVNCTLSSNVLNDVLTIKSSLIDAMIASYTQIDSSNSSDEISKIRDSVLTNLKQLSDNNEFLSDELIKKFDKILDNTLKIASSNTSLSTSQVHQTSLILDNYISYVSENDCICKTDACRNLQNKTYAYLKKVSTTALDNMIVPGQKPFLISTETFDLIVFKTTKGEITSVDIEMPNGGPLFNIVPLTTVPGSNDRILEVQVINFQSSLIGCTNKTEKSSLVINVIDSLSKESLKKYYTIKVKLSSESTCLEGCILHADFCDCDIGLFDITAQMNKIFKLSSLGDITKLSSLSAWKFYSSPVFWVNLIALLWFLGTVIILKISNRLNEYCIAHKAGSLRTLSLSKGLLYILLARMDLVSVYVLNDKLLTKRLRSAILYLRLLFLSTYASIFSFEGDDENLWSLITNLHIWTILLPYVTVNPIIHLVTFIIIKFYENEIFVTRFIKIGRIIVKIVAAALSLGCLFTMFTIAANKSSNAQLSWFATFLMTLFQETVLNPFIEAGIQIMLINYTRDKTKSSWTKRLVLRRLDSTCELFYVKRFFLISLSQKKCAFRKRNFKVHPITPVNQLKVYSVQEFDTIAVTSPDSASLVKRNHYLPVMNLKQSRMTTLEKSTEQDSKIQDQN